ncbi:hypothetical protein [Sphingobacterium chuzhouense]|uniref:hypothetical protein n=1 Tax=Sphingobacterium chuzhouense TaxID=1742264 RepID=UPI001CC1C40C|nr:hypothetical protein [Sphingobacterium chuzhouense]
MGIHQNQKKKAAEVGKGRLYGDFIKLLCDIVVGLGKRPVLWADIALKYPDALQGLPKETVFVDWNYGWDINMFGDHHNLLNSGFEVWGAPSIRSHPDNYFLTQWEKHFRNIRDFIPQARNFGYKGLIMTSWSTSGLYSTIWESTRDASDLQAIRRVYPITGFNLLIAAFFEGVNNTKPLDIESFVLQYAQKRYGFGQQKAKDFWTALKAIPYEIVQGQISDTNLSMPSFLDSAQMVASTLRRLQPSLNQDEFEHYRLMADIRLQYLTFTAIEMRVNSVDFKEDDISETLAALEALDMADLDERFIRLNKNSFFEAELKQENDYRNSKIRLLQQRLSRNKID